MDNASISKRSSLRDGRAAAQVYPANYWLGLLEIPQGEHSAKEIALETKACFSCHQVGTRATRELTKGVGSYASSLGAWDQHVMMGPNGVNMSGVFKRLGAQRKAFADWTDRIAAGAFPEPPPRPTGVERNLVISMWDWALPTSRRSDAAGTDEREFALFIRVDGVRATSIVAEFGQPPPGAVRRKSHAAHALSESPRVVRNPNARQRGMHRQG